MVGGRPIRRPVRLLHVTELVAMDDTGPEAIKVTIAGQPKVAKRQLVTVVKLVVTPWNIDDRCGGHSAPTRIAPVPTAASPAPTTGFKGRRCRRCRRIARSPRRLAALQSLGFDDACDMCRRFDGVFVFPHAHDFPPGSSESIVCVGVAESVVCDLVVPEFGCSTFRGPVVLGASVPEAAVEERRDLDDGEH
jgi:hypothetical protein